MDAVAGREPTPGGGPFNTARALARLGVPTSFLGHLSDDDHGRELAHALVADGVGMELSTVGHEPTAVATAHVDASGRVSYEFALEGTSAAHLTPEMVPTVLDPRIAAIHVGSLGLVVEPMASTLVALVEREAGSKLVMLDPNVRTGLIDDAVYRARLQAVIARSAIVKASEDDLTWLYPGLDHREAADRLLDAGARLAVVTRGAAGAYAVHSGHRAAVAAVPLHAVDTIGAGDAFGAAILAWLHDHGALRRDFSFGSSELRDALAFACLVAAITCTRAGADPPTRTEVDAAAAG